MIDVTLHLVFSRRPSLMMSPPLFTLERAGEVVRPANKTGAFFTSRHFRWKWTIMEWRGKGNRHEMLILQGSTSNVVQQGIHFDNHLSGGSPRAVCMNVLLPLFKNGTK